MIIQVGQFWSFVLILELAIVSSVLDNHAPIKRKSVRANDGPFMTKTLRKAIMNRTRLRNIHCKNRTADNLKAFIKQRNKCVNPILTGSKKVIFYRGGGVFGPLIIFATMIAMTMKLTLCHD